MSVISRLSLHFAYAIFLAIWHHKNLLYLFYLLTLQKVQNQWFYFNFQHRKLLYQFYLLITVELFFLTI